VRGRHFCSALGNSKSNQCSNYECRTNRTIERHGFAQHCDADGNGKYWFNGGDDRDPALLDPLDSLERACDGEDGAEEG